MIRSKGILKSSLPAHWRPWQRRKNTFIYYSILALLAFARVMPFFVLRFVAIILGSLGFLFAYQERRVAIQQLRKALPERQSWWGLGWRVFIHFATAAAECVKMNRFLVTDSPYIDFPPECFAAIKKIHGEGRGIMMVTPHLGNWEILAQVCAKKCDFVIHTIAKQSYDPRMTELVKEFRAKGHVQCLWRDDPAVLRKTWRTLCEGGCLGVLIDQSTRVPSVMIPFFGEWAPTPIVPAQLVQKTKCAVIFGYAVREGKQYRIQIEEVPVPRSDNAEEDALRLTTDLTMRIEKAIRTYPEQWVWMHRRWQKRSGQQAIAKTTPKVAVID